jgi:hypothetical protein
MKEHREVMLTPDVCPDDVVDEALFLLMPILKRVGRELKGLLNQDSYLEPDHYASTSACLGTTRSDGGQRWALKDAVFALSQFENEDVLDELWEELELKEMRCRIGLFKNAATGGYLENPVITVRFPPRELGVFTRILGETVEESLAFPDRPLTAMIEAVLEPLKVRVISKGPPAEYYLGKKFQVALHSVLRSMPAFRLIGRTLCPTDLMDLPFSPRRRDLKWLSIDYSGATDGLSAELSSEIMRILLDQGGISDPGLSILLRKTLQPHTILYPDFKIRKGAHTETWSPLPCLQRSGQLMGSITSFPILCLANLALYLMVRRRSHPRWSLSKCVARVLVNGDDMVYYGSEREWELHREIGALMGLKMSPGKAYIHDRYANVNSKCFDIPRGSTPRSIPFLNVGLLFGQHKVLAKVGPDKDKEEKKNLYVSVFDKVVEGAWCGKEADVAKRYLSLHRKELADECKGRNLFLPVSNGGMGVQPWLDPRPTKSQLSLFKNILKEDPYLRLSTTPIFGTRIRSIESVDRTFCPLEEVVKKPIRVKRPPSEESEFDSSSCWRILLPHAPIMVREGSS